MNTKKNHAVAFTGHRHSKLQKDAQNNPTFYEELQNEIVCTCYDLYSRGYTDFYTGMCDGFDLIAAQAVLYLKDFHPEIKLHAVLPYNGFGDTFKDNSEREKYNQILEKADTVTTISTEKNDPAYLKRNDFLLENSTTIICYHNPNRTNPRSGTLYTLNRATKYGHTTINLYSPPLPLKCKNMSYS